MKEDRHIDNSTFETAEPKHPAERTLSRQGEITHDYTLHVHCPRVFYNNLTRNVSGFPWALLTKDDFPILVLQPRPQARDLYDLAQVNILFLPHETGLMTDHCKASRKVYVVVWRETRLAQTGTIFRIMLSLSARMQRRNCWKVFNVFLAASLPIQCSSYRLRLLISQS